VVDAHLERERRVDGLLPAPGGDLDCSQIAVPSASSSRWNGAHDPVAHRLDDAAAARNSCMVVTWAALVACVVQSVWC